MSLYKRNRIFWSRIVRKGERIDRSTRCRNKVDAQAVEAKWLTEINTTGQLPQKPDKQIVRQDHAVHLLGFREALFEYLRTTVNPKTKRKCSESTVDFYVSAYKPLCQPLRSVALTDPQLCGVPLTGITAELIDAWVRDRRTHGVGPSRINASLRTLSVALNVAKKKGIITVIPDIVLEDGERVREFVVSEELLATMLEHEYCTRTLTDVMPFGMDVGLRISELINLTWDRASTKPKPGSELGWVYIDKGKSKFAKRTISLTDRAHAILGRLEAKRDKHNPYVFLSDKGKPLDRRYVSWQFRRIREALKLPDECVVHSLRHTFCTRLGETGCDAFTIQKLAGHADIKTSARYVHPTPPHLENAIKNLSKLNSK